MSGIYDSATRAVSSIEELLEIVRYRDLVRQFVRRDVLTRYKRSVVGVAWTMLSPLGMMIVLTIAFSGLFHSTRAFSVYVLSGLVAWNFFSQTTTTAMQGLVWGGALLHRIYLPRTVFAVSATGAGLVNLSLALVPLVGVMLVTGTPLTPAAVALPLSMLLLAAFALGVGLLLSTTAAYFPDVAEMYQIALLGWMYLTPVIYPESIIPETHRPWVFTLNPMYHLVKLFRMPLYDGAWPTTAQLIPAAVVSIGVLALGWITFTRNIDEFVYRL